MPPATRKRARRSSFVLALGAIGLFPGVVVLACTRTTRVDPVSGPRSAEAPSTPGPPIVDAVDASGGPDAVADTPPTSWSPSGVSVDGPREDLSIDAGRPVWYAFPGIRPGLRDAGGPPYRLVGHLHGMCGPPAYACGKWIAAGTDVGVMVCPTGNARCGDSPYGPPSWEAPSWLELVGIMDRDLETAIAKVGKKRAGSVQREGAVLTGYSRGAYAAPLIARSHPGRWPYLVLIEANVPLSAPTLVAAGVRAVALVAGERGTEIAGMRKTTAELARTGFPAELFVMARTGHLYSDDMELVMHDALTFVLAR